MATTPKTIKPRGPGGRPRTWAEPTEQGKAIIERAAQRGWNLQQVAERAGVSVACVYSIVSGRTSDPGISIAHAISGALGVRVDKLFPPRAPAARHAKLAK
jgi:transcriptional regulator with XRE-family HTH domain